MNNKNQCFEAEEMWLHFQQANSRSCDCRNQMTKDSNYAPFDLRIFIDFQKIWDHFVFFLWSTFHLLRVDSFK
jgi:hypothetical protein